MEVTDDAIELDDPAGVGVVRRRVVALAALAGFDEVRAGQAALIATELASNVVKHAGHGGAIVTRRADRIAIAVWDRGPGMNVEACLRDGMSTAGTAGNGLGAVRRLAETWDCYSTPSGTVVTATIGAAPGKTFVVGGVCVPVRGEHVCGDAWDVHVAGDRATLLVCDGLGHGEGAAQASARVVEAFRARPEAPLAEILDRAHQAARSTRGAAATIARIDVAARRLVVAGVGNVGAWLLDGPDQRALVTQHGTLGQATPRIREETYPFPPHAQLLACSDGIKSRLDLPRELTTHDPTTIATAIWRDHARGRDDATAVLVRARV